MCKCEATMNYQFHLSAFALCVLIKCFILKRIINVDYQTFKVLANAMFLVKNTFKFEIDIFSLGEVRDKYPLISNLLF